MAVVEAMRAARIGTAWEAAPTAAGQLVGSEHNLIVLSCHIESLERPEPADPLTRRPAQSGQECRAAIRHGPPEYIHSQQVTVTVQTKHTFPLPGEKKEKEMIINNF